MDWEAQFDWCTDLALRRELQIGTVLETYDFGYIRVDAITPEGVVGPGLDSPAELTTWAQLRWMRCRVHSQPGWPGHDALQVPVPRLVQRGGRIDLEHDQVLVGSASVEALDAASGPGSPLQGEDLDKEFLRALARAAAPGWYRIDCELAIHHAEAFVEIHTTCVTDEDDMVLASDPEALALAGKLGEEARDCRGTDCVGITVWLERQGDGEYSYEARFVYAPSGG